MTTLDLNRIEPSTHVRIQRSPASDLECDSIGLVHEAHRTVYRAVKANGGVRSETVLARMCSMSDVDTTRAVNDLIHMGIIRRGHTAFSVGAFELIPQRTPVQRGSL